MKEKTPLIYRADGPHLSRGASVNIRYSPEVVDAFRATGSGWQTRMNAALKDWLRQHKPEDVKLP
ncbi:BrnA antitoxin family protein [Salmonella enterica]